jgi:hypothetical protein
MHSSYQGGDPADYPQASCGFDYDAVDESIARHDKAVRQRAGASIPAAVVLAITEPMRTSDALFKFIALVIDSTDYLLKIDVAIAAIGIPLYQGCSYTEMAAKHGISKQAFDKHVLKFQKDFQLPITRSQKSPQARLSYKQHQLARVERIKQKAAATKEREETVWQNSLAKVPKGQSED